MSVKYKLINSVELDRKGRIRYVKTFNAAGSALPTSCPNIAPQTCFPSDPVTDPVGGPNWTTFEYSGTPGHGVTNCGAGGAVTNGGFDFIVEQLAGQVTPNMTTSGIYNPYPPLSSFCEASITFDRFVEVGAPTLQARGLGVGLRMNPAASVHHYSGYVCEINRLNNPNPDQLSVWKVNTNGSIFSMGGAIHPWVHGDVVRFTVANFFAFNEIRVCWKAFVNGVLLTSGTDFGGGQFITGKSGFAIVSSLFASPNDANHRELDLNNWTSCVDVVV